MGPQRHNYLQLPEVTTKSLPSAKASPAPPITGVIWSGLIGAILCQVLLLIVVGKHNRYVLDPDIIAYIRLAWYYATGQFHLAVSGYWGPLFSWLMVPWIGWTDHLVDAARIVTDLSAVLFVFGCIAIFRSLCLPPVALLVGTWLAALATVLWSVEYIGPDLLMSGLFGLALGQMLRVRWCTSRLTPWLTGVLCGMAYLAKAIALPATVSCCVGVGVLWAFSYRLPWRQVSQSVGLTLLGCALVAGPWIAVLSWKYQTPTFSTSGAIAHAIVGPEDVQRRHPFRRIFHHPETGRLFSFEDPASLPYHYWSPLTNLAYAKHQLALIYGNYSRVLTILKDFDVLSIGLFALVSGVLVPGRLRWRLQVEPWRWAVVPVICLVVWYLPVYAEDHRYYFLTYPLLLAASLGLVMSWSRHLRGWQRGVWCVGLLLVVSSFALPMLTKLPKVLRGLETPCVAAHELATKLQAAQISGPLAGIGNLEELYVGLSIAFFTNQPFYGVEHQPTLERIKAAQATLYVIPRNSSLLVQLDADAAFRNLDALLFTSAEEAQRYPWRVYQMLTP
jgi:hypothetical protein